MKKSLYFIIICIFLAILNNCDYYGQNSGDLTLDDNEVCIKLLKPNFIGNWKDYYDNSVDKLNIKANLLTGSTPDINYNLDLVYSTSGNFSPSINFSENIFNLNSDIKQDDASKIKTDTLKIDSKFSNNTGTYKACSDSINVKIQYYSEITLNYSANEPALDLEINKETSWFVSGGYNYKVNYEVLRKDKSKLATKKDKLNLVVMAEGFRADQIEKYREYVKYAFDITSDANRFLKNNVFKKYWDEDKINVIRMDTISPEAGVDTSWNCDNVKSILKFNSGYVVRLPDQNRVKAVMAQTKPLDMGIDDVDAFIFFVNAPNLGAYALFPFILDIASYGMKNGEPINPVVIQTEFSTQNIEKTKSVLNEDLLYRVCIRAIPHELGHALAKLDDEYISNDFIYRIFNGASKIRKNSRNCDSTNQITESKFGNFFNHGYENLTNDYKLKFFEGGAYNATGVYRTSEFCLMNNPNDNRLQYNPISSYHIAGTLVTRIGSTPFDLPEDLSIPENLEWKTYPLSQFFTDFPPDKFVDPK